MIRIRYRDDVKLNDILTIHDEKYIVTSMNYDEITLEPVEAFVMRNSMIIYEGRYQTIQEVVDYKAEKLVSDRDKGLTFKWEEMIGRPR